MFGMDLEVARLVSSTVFLGVIFAKQYWDGLKLLKQYGEAVAVFRSVPRLTESSVSCQSEILTQLRLLTQQIETLSTSLERTAGVLPDRRSSPK